MPAHVKVAEGLQRDFSLNHTLSMYLLEVLPKLDPASETYALDVVSLVESILESPDVVLYAQLDKAQGREGARAEGAGRGVRPADGRAGEGRAPQAEPADFIYGTFNEFAAKHPWVGEGEHPAQVHRARACSRRCDLPRVRADYGLQRSEGVLLRYLSDAYKTLVQNVPERFRNEELEDVIAFLRATLRAGGLEPARRVGADAQPGGGRSTPSRWWSASPRT